MQHVVVTFTPADPRVAIERDARTDVIAPDGTITIHGIAIRLIDQVSGRTVVRDAGRLTFGVDGGLESHGPHPFIEEENVAPLSCPGLFTGS